jgi:hypothetical protein
MAELRTPTTPEQGPDHEGEEAGTSIEKFKSGEERDKAYVELEKFTRSQGEQLATLQKQLEDLNLTLHQRQSDDRSYGDYSRYTYPGQPETVYGNDPQSDVKRRFYVDPIQVIDEKLQHTASKVIQAVEERMAHQEMVHSFKLDNPDLVKHEPLVASFVRRQDPRLPPHEKLSRAAKEARAYLAEVARGGSPQSQGPNPDAYVETPTGHRAPQTAPKSEPAYSIDDEVSEYVKTHATTRDKRRI